ncbi:type I restriction endonuclease subunit R [Aerococcaceae bacterium NML190938]|nr:type I restriction endonuclease subunit R [Aerococcaceae bacterium NML190938]
MPTHYETITELKDGIILAKFDKAPRVEEAYQTEYELETQLIRDLDRQGYQYVQIHTPEELLSNLKQQLERLNRVTFSLQEWERLLVNYLNAPNDGIVEKTRKIHQDYIYDFIFDDGHLENIYLIDKDDVHNNHFQVIRQMRQVGTHQNRYDVTILVNGLPLVQIELKKRGASIAEAFNQIHRYSKESFNTVNSLYKYIQLFVISNGTQTRYFANTTERTQTNYEFTCEWADAKNNPIHDLEDFTSTFFDKRTLCEVLTKYCVFNASDKLMIMRPYQIAATERILWRIKCSYDNKTYGTTDAGGYIWHTTGSGKTLTSFKAARLATKLPYIDKVFFVVDRKDLDYQTMREYEKFQKGSVNGSANTQKLKENIEVQDDKIVVTTIQKLNVFMKKYPEHSIYQKHCVFIFDECHRSQFGEAQKNLTQLFKCYYQFGFTGTPIFKENAIGPQTTANVFGRQLHSYIITDAIRDKKVLKFKVDYTKVATRFVDAEQRVSLEEDTKKLAAMERKMLLHPERIEKIAEHILKVFNAKTHRNEHISLQEKRRHGFNAMFAVQSVEAAKLYYEVFEQLQAHKPEDKRLRVATIFSFAANETQSAIGEIEDENFEPTAMDSTAKEFLEKAIRDYNRTFKTNFSTESKEFQNYYRDLAKQVREREIDLLIVVGMFLTGFDAPCLNTLFVDKNLKYHGLIQAYSRTNRILNSVKRFGNIVCFRDLEQATKDAIALFGEGNSVQLITEKSYDEYKEGYTDLDGNKVDGYVEICQQLIEKFPDPTELLSAPESEQKEFVELFGEMLKAETILKNYDEFYEEEPLISERLMQDMKSAYIDIRQFVLEQGGAQESEVDFSDIEFQIELLKTDEINLDYILKLISEKSKETNNTAELQESIQRAIRSSMDIRAKEALIMEFIQEIDLTQQIKPEEVMETFYQFARQKKETAMQTVIQAQNLKEQALDYIKKAILKGHASMEGTELDNILPPTSRRAGAREAKKHEVQLAIQRIADIFVGI